MLSVESTHGICCNLKGPIPNQILNCLQLPSSSYVVISICIVGPLEAPKQIEVLELSAFTSPGELTGFHILELIDVTYLVSGKSDDMPMPNCHLVLKIVIACEAFALQKMRGV